MIRKDALVLYKQKPARISEISDKITISIPGGKEKKVRLQDIFLLHDGPCPADLDFPAFDEESIEEAWSLLQEETPSLAEIAEFSFGENTPRSLWQAFLLLNRTPYYKGIPQEIIVCDEERVAQWKEKKRKEEEEENAWNDFLARLKKKQFNEDDSFFFRDLVLFACRESKKSRILSALKKNQLPESAHALLLEYKAVDTSFNPYPRRLDLPMKSPDISLPQAEKIERQDFTAMKALAIDDEGCKDPDDALSFENNTLWVHIADAPLYVQAGGDIDREASMRGANLYLPEGTVPMLPEEITARLGLGLNETSPAVSFGIKIGETGDIESFEIVRSLVKVDRLSYTQADTMMEFEPLRSIREVCEKYRTERLKRGAFSLSLPEAKVLVDKDGKVSVRALARAESREIVTDAMLMAGEQTALYCGRHSLPVPYVVQPSPDGDPDKVSQDNMASMFAQRRRMKRSRITLEPGLHAGLGLPVYTRVTSPLRRYPDLMVMQQLCRRMDGREPLSEDEIQNGLASYESVIGLVVSAERQSLQHWKLVYLIQNPDWKGKAILAAKEQKSYLYVIPELALEMRMPVNKKLSLNAEIEIYCESVDLPALNAVFKQVLDG